MIDFEEIRRWQDEWTEQWHGADNEVSAPEEFVLLVQGNHRANFELWHEEDKARDPRATDGEIAGVKRAIDRLNQQRNDVVERMDEHLMLRAPEQSLETPLHTETPGMMIDRMSILALKIFHTREQVERKDVSAADRERHRERNRERLRVLEEQRADLTRGVAQVWSAVLRGERRFKLYRQMKMYNDPELNPAIYGSRSGSTKQG